MARAGDSTAGIWISLDPSLEALFTRLEALSLEPRFQLQRQVALGRALQPYAGVGATAALPPLAEEFALARLYLYADFYPEDGQLSLIEQVRDLIEVHVPEEEREWLDPLRHSYMDLCEVLSLEGAEQAAHLTLRSLGDGQEAMVEKVELHRTVQVGQVLLTRLIKREKRVVLPGTAVLLSAAVARSILEATNQARLEIEALGGSFELGKWDEFAKRYGHFLLWNLTQARLEGLIQSESHIQYRAANSQLLLYAVALYEHHEFKFLSDELGGMGEWQPVETHLSQSLPKQAVRAWEQRADTGRAGGDVVVRLTLTPTQLLVECDSHERLDRVKHQLASTFGFSLHFRGETTARPRHALIEPDVAKKEAASRIIIVDAEEEHRLLAALLENVYLEWADRPSPALGGKTPRHAAADSEKSRSQVAALVDEAERNDIAQRRTGKPGYDYNQLRAHVGL